MCFAPDDEMIHAFAPDRSDQPFSEAILPRRGRCNGFVPDAHRTQNTRTKLSDIVHPVSSLQLTKRLDGVRSFGDTQSAYGARRASRCACCLLRREGLLPSGLARRAPRPRLAARGWRTVSTICPSKPTRSGRGISGKRKPPLLLNSRLIVEGDRPRSWAICHARSLRAPQASALPKLSAVALEQFLH
jgi:hypothetical protein